MRALVRWFDGWLSGRLKIFIFSCEPGCILRLQVRKAPHAMRLGEMLIEKGETVLVLHLWSERLPPFAPAGPDMAWAAQTARQFRQSLAAMAGYIQRNPQLSKARALMGVTALFPPPREGQRHPMERFGFTVVPYRGPLGRFGEFWENFYSWLLIWTYHPNSAGSQRLVEMRRTEIWIPIAEMIARYGEKSTP